MEDTRNNEDWDVAAYREKLLASSHGKTRKLSAKEVVALYMQDQSKEDSQLKGKMSIGIHRSMRM